jgi:hypothetical protein
MITVLVRRLAKNPWHSCVVYMDAEALTSDCGGPASSYYCQNGLNNSIYIFAVVCLRITILWHPVVTSEIHSYLQNSNSTFFLIYAYDYRQHTTSPSFTYSIVIETQPKHMAFLCTSIRHFGHRYIIHNTSRNSMILDGQGIHHRLSSIHGTKTHGSQLRLKIQ